MPGSIFVGCICPIFWLVADQHLGQSLYFLHRRLPLCRVWMCTLDFLLETDCTQDLLTQHCFAGHQRTTIPSATMPSTIVAI